MRSTLREQLIALLADGNFHSGEHMARQLGVSRTAVWKALNTLGELGLELHRVPKRGYRLAQSLELLDAKAIVRALNADSRTRLRKLEVLLQTDSTNNRLLAVHDLPAERHDVCLAEFQSTGRGRRGRSWVSSFGDSLCLSVSASFPETPRHLSALSLAAGVSVLRALSRLGAQGLRLKWPNDILFEQRKLGGILTELRAESAGPVYVVVGVGLNLRLTSKVRARIRDNESEQGMQPAALIEATKEGACSRSVLAAALVEHLIAMLAEFQRSGFRVFAAEWREADALAARPALLMVGSETHKGIARGIDEDGAFILETPGKLLRFTSGEVSLRPGA